MAPHSITPAPERDDRRQRGFTLIEVMIALVLTALSVMGIISLYITETKASGFSRHNAEAAILAQDKVEQLRTIGKAAISSTSQTNVDERGLPGGIFTRTWSETVGGSFADITVTVTWVESAVTHTVTVKARRN